MPLNCMLQICKVTRASKLFQRNFYLPLMRPLSPKDAYRRHVLTGTNLLGKKMDHYIPVLEEYKERVQRRKYRVKGEGKKRQRKRTSMKYVAPFFDDYMEGHGEVQNLCLRKGRGKGQWYTYYIPDKDVTLVLDHQMERAIRDKDIVDVIIAQRSEKIIVKLASGKKVSLPIASWDEKGSLYRGEGWTKKEIEEYHHHGRETMGLARLFEAREAGVEEWELELMKMASKRKTKHRVEHKPEFKQILNEVAENMDWEKFEEEAKEIVEEAHDAVEDEPIPMKINDMEKTKHVNEKLKAGGDEALEMLPLLEDIPEVTRFMQDGEFTDVAGVSGALISLPITGKDVFVPGQMVDSEDGEIFMAGQTIEDEENETSEFTPGITCMMDGEPSLVNGLIMGNDPKHPMFLPGDSTITESGELQFTETDDDRPWGDEPEEVEEPQDLEEPELEEEQNSEEEEEDMKPPPPPPPKKEMIYVRPKRLQLNIDWGIKRREKAPKKPVISLDNDKAVADIQSRHVAEIEAVVFDMTLPTFEKEVQVQAKERIEKRTEKKSREEWSIEKKKKEIKEKGKAIILAYPKTVEYKAAEPVRKSETLNEIEQQVKKGSFLKDYKQFMIPKEKPTRFNWKEPVEIQTLGKSVGLVRHKVWQRGGTK